MKLIDVYLPLSMGIVGLGAALTLGGGFGHQFAVLGVGVGLFATGFGLVATKLHRAWEQVHAGPDFLRADFLHHNTL